MPPLPFRLAEEVPGGCPPGGTSSTGTRAGAIPVPPLLPPRCPGQTRPRRTGHGQLWSPCRTEGTGLGWLYGGVRTPPAGQGNHTSNGQGSLPQESRWGPETSGGAAHGMRQGIRGRQLMLRGAMLRVFKPPPLPRPAQLWPPVPTAPHDLLLGGLPRRKLERTPPPPKPHRPLRQPRVPRAESSSNPLERASLMRR